MKILFLTSEHEDYLADSLFHGLRNLLGEDVIDFPKKDFLYKGFIENNIIRGKAFTLYGLLDDIPVNRNKVFDRFSKGEIELIIFSSIQRQLGFYLELYPFLNKVNTVIIDGEDTPALFPYKGYYWRKYYHWFIPSPHKKFNYYKREWTSGTNYYRYYKVLPKWICEKIASPSNLHRISLSIPGEKILNEVPHKKKLFPLHIVDEEISDNTQGSYTGYVFENEEDYYKDLQSSKFGITTKRAGWDCLRHYEIAANGAVLCFRDLDKKPVTCAPHGLNETNCIIYSSFQDLMNKINSLSEAKYREMQIKSLEWVRENTTVRRAEKLSEDFNIKK